MSIITAILTGIASIANYGLWATDKLPYAASVAAQIVLLAVTIVAAVTFRGRRTIRPSYLYHPLFTFRFTVVVISLMGNAAVLAGILLDLK